MTKPVVVKSLIAVFLSAVIIAFVFPYLYQFAEESCVNLVGNYAVKCWLITDTPVIFAILGISLPFIIYKQLRRFIK